MRSLTAYGLPLRTKGRGSNTFVCWIRVTGKKRKYSDEISSSVTTRWTTTYNLKVEKVFKWVQLKLTSTETEIKIWDKLWWVHYTDEQNQNWTGEQIFEVVAHCSLKHNRMHSYKWKQKDFNTWQFSSTVAQGFFWKESCWMFPDMRSVMTTIKRYSRQDTARYSQGLTLAL